MASLANTSNKNLRDAAVRLEPVNLRSNVNVPTAQVEGLPALVAASKVVDLQPDSQVFQVPKTGSAAPAVIKIAASIRNIVGTSVWDVPSGTATLTDGVGADAGKKLVTFDNMGTDTATIRLTVTEAGSNTPYYDAVTLVKVREGSDAVNPILSNESHTIPADKDGNVASFTGATSTMTIFVGSVDTTALWAFSRTISNASVSSTISGSTVTLTGLTSDSGYIDITATRTGFASITKRFSFSKSKAGTSGADGLTMFRVQLYQRTASAAAPASPNANVTVDMATGAVSGLTNSWVAGVPALDATKPYLHTILATARTSAATFAIVPASWSGDVVLTQDGTSGTSGLNSATVRIYQRTNSATAPALPSVTSTLTFIGGGIANLNNGWSITVPPSDPAKPYLHTSQATAAAITPTDDIPAGEWAAVQLMQDAVIVGGRNYARNSRSILDIPNNTGLGTSAARNDEAIPYYRITATSSVSTFTDWIVLSGVPAGTLCTISTEVRIGAAGIVSRYAGAGAVDVPANVWTRISFRFIYDGVGVRGGHTYAGTVLDYRNYKVEVGNTGTDWTPAPEDVSSAISAAQAAADAANARHEAIASDGVFSRSEKLADITEWQGVNQEATQLQIKADNLGVAHGVLDLRFAELTNYLNSVEYTLIDRDTAINRSAYRLAWTNYYKEQSALIGALAAKASTMATGVTMGADGYLYGAGGGRVETVPVIDRDREINRPPSWYLVGTTREFKHYAALGLPQQVETPWFTLETIKQFPVNGTGFPGYQYAYYYNKTYRRRSIDDAGTGWTAWVLDLDRTSYTGDLDASRGAPVGTFVGDTLAETVTANSWQGAAAMGRVTSISANNTLDRSEKPDLVQVWNAILAERDDLTSKADALGVNRDAYWSAYMAVYDLLVNIPGGWSDTNTDSAINRTSFNSTFSTYIGERTKLQNATTAKAATTANTDGSIRTPIGAANSWPGQATGAIKIRLPQTWSDTMLKFKVDIYEYLAGYSCELEIAGYNYSGNGQGWYAASARVQGGSNVEYPVRFGHDGTKCCVWIGNPGDTWDYPKIQVRDIFAGHTNFSRAQWESGWEVSMDTVGAINVSPGGAILDTLPGADWAKVPNKNGRPENNATVGANWNANLYNRPSDGQLLNAYISVDANGNLLGGGGGRVTNIAVVDDSNQRYTNQSPAWYVATFGGAAMIRREFKWAGSIDLPHNEWCALETTIQYADYSGGACYQYAYVGTRTYRRFAVNTQSSWTSWVMDLDRNSYTGDLNATVGAPNGTYVSGTLAETLANQASSGATAAATLNDGYAVASMSDFLGNTSNGTQTYGSRTATPINGGTGPFTYSWSLEKESGNVTMTGANTATATFSGTGNDVYNTAYATVTIVDSKGRAAVGQLMIDKRHGNGVRM